MVRLDQTFIRNIKDLIESGENRRVAGLLSRGLPKKIQRQYRLPLAWGARRAGLSELALRILNPLVRPPPRAVVRATENEKVEYAACLIKLGASLEAFRLLDRLSDSDVPEVNLYKAYALITQWEYEGAIPLLQQYSSTESVEPYQRLVAQVNLAAAFVHERYFGLAKKLLKDLLQETEVRKLRQLHGNVLEISAQHAIFESRWDEADAFLQRATNLLQNVKGLDLFFVEKWKAILAALRFDGKKGSVKAVASIKQAALKRRHWETVRECDLYSAYATRNDELLIHVFFGTPYESYRRKLMSGYGYPLSVPSSYMWCYSSQKDPSIILDLETGKTNLKETQLRSGHLLHRLFLTLGSDFYKPFSVAALHSQIYPGQYYNPSSSPAKIHELVKRGRKWMRSNNLPLVINESASAYQLHITNNLGIRCRYRNIPKDKHAQLIKRIQSTWPENPFSAKELAGLLKISPRTARRVLHEVERKGTIIRIGTSSDTLYKLAS